MRARSSMRLYTTLVHAYERRCTFRPGANLRNWLLSILHNTFVDGYPYAARSMSQLWPLAYIHGGLRARLPRGRRCVMPVATPTPTVARAMARERAPMPR
jgi:DNA-directed RNA polymerase specialized sigma24 family protein